MPISANELCEWLQAILLEKPFRIAQDKEHPNMVAHRLDAICSGLVLVAMTSEGSALLTWQFSGGIVMREYMVSC